jgi:hypothetical protein
MFDNRLGDNWTLMLAIANHAGGEWPEKARQAALAVSKVVGAADASTGVKLLADIRAIFEAKGVDRLPSKELTIALGAMEDRPWSEWKGGKPITQNQLARLLGVGAYGIVPDNIRIGNSVPKGYQLTQFQDAFERCLQDWSPGPSNDDAASGADGQDALPLDKGEPKSRGPNSYCHNSDGQVFQIRDAHAGPGSKSEPLHECCAPQYFG